MLPVLLVDAGLALCGLGLLCLIRPPRRLRVSTRARAAAVLAAGAGLVVLALLWPAGPIRLAGPPMRLDGIVPVYQFGEAHQTRVHASPERVYRVLREVTADEIRLFRLLTWLRSPRLARHGRELESILNPAARASILDVALRSGFLLLAEDPPRELVFGTIVCCAPVRRPRDATEYLALEGPSVAKAVMNFRLDDEGDGWTRLRTQTRVFASDDHARRRFAAYWRVIYPGSALIRRMWLQAVKRRAEVGA